MICVKGESIQNNRKKLVNLKGGKSFRNEGGKSVRKEEKDVKINITRKMARPNEKPNTNENKA